MKYFPLTTHCVRASQSRRAASHNDRGLGKDSAIGCDKRAEEQ